MGDRLLVGFVAALIAFLAGLAVGYGEIGEALRTFPAPTEHWATIVAGLAWPALLLLFVLRFESSVASLLATLARRVSQDRRVEVGPVRFERDIRESIDLPLSVELLGLIEDGERAPRLLAFIERAGLTPPPTAYKFCTDPLYERYHAGALAELRKP